MSTQWELRAIVSAELAEALDAHFYELEPAPWGIQQKERHDPYELFGFFPDPKAADVALAELRTAFADLPEDFELNSIEDQEWQDAYKAYIQPWSDRQLHWIPLWERGKTVAPETAAVVYLEAGMAFGTGSHETTRLCAGRLLDFLEARPTATSTARVIDAGCGSGVLAFSAAALGFEKIEAFDNDPEVISVCQNNARENPHLPALSFKVADLQSGLPPGQADLLLANIQADILMPAADFLLRALRPGGTLALSGILTREIETVREHFESVAKSLFKGLFEMNSREDGEWADLCIRLKD
jgi:ribosomal protein L11 methyltransferase